MGCLSGCLMSSASIQKLFCGICLAFKCSFNELVGENGLPVLFLCHFRTAQGKLEVVKQEMARVNVNILGISELKWTGMGEFNSDDHYIYYRGKESLEEMK